MEAPVDFKFQLSTTQVNMYPAQIISNIHKWLQKNERKILTECVGAAERVQCLQNISRSAEKTVINFGKQYGIVNNTRKHSG